MFKSNILIAYACTPITEQRFIKAQQTQNALYMDIINKYDKLVISNVSTITTDATIVTAKLYDTSVNKSNQFNYSRWKNVAFEYAIENRYEWILLVDGDCIVQEECTTFPETGISRPPVYMSKENDTIYNLNSIDIESYKRVSWFLINNSIFSKYKFDEEYIGYGYEDWAFIHELQNNNVHIGNVGPRLIHLYHSPAEKRIDGEVMLRNKEIFYKKYKK